MTSSERRPFLKAFFLDREPRLRFGWRLLFQTMLMLFLTILFSMPFLVFSGVITELGDFGPQIGSAIGIVVSIWLARRFFDRRTYNGLGVGFEGAWLKDTLVGIGIAALIMAFIFALLLAFGWLNIQGFIWQGRSAAQVVSQLSIWLLIFVAVGYYEELLSRGYHLQNIADAFGLVWAVVISSSVFGVLHLTNPHATVFSTIGITAAGLFLAYGYVRTGKLWLPIGLHIGWNYFEGVIFGFPVSGIATARLIEHTVTGPTWFTGGAFGPEAGLVSVLAMAIGALLIWLYTRETPTGPAA